MRIILVFICCLSLNKSFCQIIKIDSVVLIDGYNQILEKKVHVYNVLKVGDDTVKIDVLFGDTVFYDNLLSYDRDSYISTELYIRGKTIKLTDAIILSNGVDSVSDINVPLTYEPRDWAETGIMYYKLKDIENEFVILDVSSYGCQGSFCGYGYYFIFNLSGSDVKLYVVPHDGSQPFSFQDNLFSIENGELNLKLYIENEDRKCGEIYQYKLYHNKLVKLNLVQKICW